MAKVIFDGAGEMPELNRITAKKNYASSSQAHKMGATAMFNDILHYLGKEKYPKLINEVEGQVAVRQHPVYAFQKIPIEGSEGQYNRKFIGLFTVGPDKGDKNYFGFTNSRIKDRAIRLEGTDHLKGVGFNYPWTVNGVDKIKYNHAEESLCIITGNDKTKWTKIWEQSVCGNKETEAEIEAYLKEVYKPAYEVAYHNNPLIVGVDMTLSEINSNIEAFGKRRRVKDNRQYSYCEFWIDGEYDIYYLDAQTNKYEKNGINLLSDLGITADEIAGMTIEEKNNLFISRRVARFKEEAKYYFCIDDAVYQLMFLFIIVASDNFEKNMYPYIMELLWRFFQDDLDSIFSTDNQAQNTKKYSAELHDFTDDTKSAYVFKGEDSAFWQLIELAYEDECKQMGRDIFQAMYDLAPRGTTTMEKLMAFFDEYFFNRAQKYFTPSAYNNDTEYSYEEAWNNKEYVASVDIHPLAQALGSQESTERAFLEKRLIYLMSKFGFGGFASATDTDLGIISVRTQDPQSFTLTPAIDLYPTVLGGQAQSAVAIERVMAGQPVTLPAVGGGNTNVYIVGADWLSDIGDLKDLKVDPSSVVTLTISSKRLRRIKVGDENADSVTSYLGSLSIQKCDSLETIDARNLQTLVGTVNLSNCPRLVEALFGGSNANAIIIAPGSKVEKLQFSDSITTIDLRNNTFLKDVEITNFAKIRFLRLENVPIINGFDVLRQAYNTDGQQLENIRIIGFTCTGSANDLFMLSNIAEGKDKDGNAHKYGSIDANGDPDENSLPVIEGSLHITESVNRNTLDFVQEAFHALALTADNIVDYFIFADPEVNRIVAENWGDGNGTTVEQIEAITNIGTVFRGNTVIETFDEFDKFTGQVFDVWKPEAAFRECTSLRSIKFPPQMTTIPVYFLSGATSLEIDITNEFQNVTYISREAFKNTKIYGELNLPNIEELQSNGEQFANTNISKVIINGSVENIPQSCFKGCTFLTDVILGENVKYLSNSAFDNCNISKIDLSKVKLVKDASFRDNSELSGTIDLSSIYTSEEGTGVGGYAFLRCGILDKVIFPTYPFKIGSSVFDSTTVKVIENINYLVSIGGTKDANIEQEFDVLEFPYLTTVDRYGLSGIKAKKIIFQKLTNIGDKTLTSGDVGLGSPNYVESLEFSDTLTSITKNGLRGYNKLNSIVFKSITPPELATNYALNNTNDCPIYVPDASVEAYKTATNWVTYAPRIQSIFYYLGYIDFVDPAVRDICVANFDSDGDGVVSMEEAAAVTDIGNLFRGNTSITSFDEFKYFNGITTLKDTFRGASNLKSITFPNSLTTFSGYHGLRHTGLESLTIPKTITNMGFEFFIDNKNLKTIHIETEATFDGSSFANCPLETITVNADNAKYSSVNNFLLNKTMNELVLAPINIEDGFPLTVETIKACALFNAAFGDVFELPENVIKIEQSNFEKFYGKLIVKNCVDLGNRGCKAKTIICFDNCVFTQWESLSFTDNLKTLILQGNSVNPANNGTFNDRNMARGTGNVYVPSDLVESYKVSAGWSKIESLIKPINEAATLPVIGSVAENDLYKVGDVYWKAELVDNVLTWVEI